MVQKKFLIDGMMCAACSSAVEKALKKTEGISSLSVNLATGTAKIEYDESILSEQQIESVIKKAGFTARIPQQNSFPQQPPKDSGIKRLIGMAIFAIPLIILTMSEMLFEGLPYFFSPKTAPITYVSIQLFLTVPVLFFARKTYYTGFKTLIRKAPSMDTLVALGTLSCLLYSVYASIKVYTGYSDYAMKLYFESAAMILLFVYTGKFLEQRSKNKAADSIKTLIELQPEVAHLVRNGEIIDISPDLLRKDDIIRILPGESVPADCIIEQGQTETDESMLTGESLPVAKKEQEEIYNGTLNISASVTAKVKFENTKSVLSGIIKAVDDAQSSKAPVAKIADKVAGYFVPTVFGLACVSGLLWLLIGKNPNAALNAFISILVVACPCALGLATPTAIITATGTAAKNGTFFKDGEALQIFSGVDTFIFDKTGTLTKGKPHVISIYASNCTENELLEITACAEFSGTHPIAQAIREAADSKNINYSRDYRVENIPGKGMISKNESDIIIVGNREFLNENGIEIKDSPNVTGTAVFTAKKSADESNSFRYMGVIILADEIKNDASEVIKQINTLGKKSIMTTGDNKNTADRVGKELAIHEVHAEVLPVNKSETVKKIKSTGSKVAFIGDGINDAPALAQADVGIAIGSGTKAAITSADVVIMGDKLTPILTAYKLSKKTMRIIKQNLLWAFAYNLISIPIAAGLLTVLGLNQPEPMFAALAMSLSSITVVTNSLRLRRK